MIQDPAEINAVSIGTTLLVQQKELNEKKERVHALSRRLGVAHYVFPSRGCVRIVFCKRVQTRTHSKFRIRARDPPTPAVSHSLPRGAHILLPSRTQIPVGFLRLGVRWLRVHGVSPLVVAGGHRQVAICSLFVKGGGCRFVRRILVGRARISLDVCTFGQSTSEHCECQRHTPLRKDLRMWCCANTTQHNYFPLKTHLHLSTKNKKQYPLLC